MTNFNYTIAFGKLPKTPTDILDLYVTIENNGDEDLSVSNHLGVRGREPQFRIKASLGNDGVGSFTVPPGETLRREVVGLRINIARFADEKGSVQEHLSFCGYAGVGTDLDPVFLPADPLPVSVDMSEVNWLSTDYGTRSHFCAVGQDVFYVSADAGTCRLPEIKAADARALTTTCLTYGDSVYLRNHGKSKQPKAPLQGLNDLFYRDADQIWTPYGKAKVDDPESFETIDIEGSPMQNSKNREPNIQPFTRGFYCAYGRDKTAGYFFTENSSTKHAIKLRGCKSPEKLVSLGFGFAKDDAKIYFEGKSFKGPDPATFEVLNAQYRQDKSGIWYGDRHVADIDPATFVLVAAPEDLEMGRIDTTFSSWCKDAAGYLGFGHRKPPRGSYEEKRAKFKERLANRPSQVPF